MKHFFYLTAFLLLSTLALAQPEGNLHKRFGLKVGANYSILNGSINDNISFKPGLYIGGYYQARLQHNVGFMIELAYSQLGCNNNYQPTTSSASGNTVLYLNYLVMPLTFKFYISKGFNIQLGAYAASRLNAVEKGTVQVTTYGNGGYYGNTSQTQTQTLNQNDNSVFSSYDAGIGAGLGYDFPFGLNFNLKYNTSLVNIDPSYKQITAKGLHNEYFQFTAGYSLGPKKATKTARPLPTNY